MDPRKRKRLEAAGYKLESVQEFLGLTDEEAAYIELRLALSRLLRSLRQGKKVTQTKLADRLGSSQSRVAKMEAADPSVSLDLLLRAILALGAKLNDIATFLAAQEKRAA